MLVDACEVPDGTVVHTDLCIAGGGIAGIRVARKFAAAAFRVCLLEGGAFLGAKDKQDFCRGKKSHKSPIKPSEAKRVVASTHDRDAVTRYQYEDRLRVNADNISTFLGAEVASIGYDSAEKTTYLRITTPIRTQFMVSTRYFIVVPMESVRPKAVMNRPDRLAEIIRGIRFHDGEPTT